MLYFEPLRWEQAKRTSFLRLRIEKISRELEGSVMGNKTKKWVLIKAQRTSWVINEADCSQVCCSLNMRRRDFLDQLACGFVTLAIGCFNEFSKFHFCCADNFPLLRLLLYGSRQLFVPVKAKARPRVSQLRYWCSQVPIFKMVTSVSCQKVGMFPLLVNRSKSACRLVGSRCR